MHLDEKLNILKKKLFPEDLVIPFNDFKSIKKKIETKFLTLEDFDHPFSKWKERLKGFQKISLEEEPFAFLEDQLGSESKYWWVFEENSSFDGSRHLLFDATLKGGQHLYPLFKNSPIFVINKKYNWMLMVDVKNGLVRQSGIV